MIVKILEPIYKDKSLNDGSDEIIRTLSGFYSKKIDVNYISEIQELINERTKKPYKKRCLLKTEDEWVIANHSFEDLYNLKYYRTIITGFYGKLKRRTR